MARSFPGTNQYSYSGTAGTLDGASAVTLAGWIYPTSLAAARSAFGNWQSVSGASAFVRLSNSTTLLFSINIAGVERSLSNANFTWTLNTWQHFAATWDGTTLRAYRNGTVGATTSSFSGTIQSGATQNWATGAREPLGSDRWNGAIAECAVWRDVALNADEVGALAKGFQPPLVRRSGLVLYWDMLTTVRDTITQTDGTFGGTGSVTAFDHPTSTIMPASPIYHPKGAVVTRLWWPFVRPSSIGELTGGIYA